jgi:hypothetical protein
MTDIREKVRRSAAEVREKRAAYEAAIDARDQHILDAVAYGVRVQDVIEDAGFTQQSGRNRLQQIRARMARRGTR